MGVHELGLRKAILKGIVDYKAIQSKADKKEKELKEGKQEPAEPDAAAAAAPPESKVEPQAAPEEVFARINTECVVCMENNVSALKPIFNTVNLIKVNIKQDLLLVSNCCEI